MKTLFVIFTLLIVSSKAFAKEQRLDLQRCNLSYASSLIKKQIADEVRDIRNVDIKTLDVSFSERFLSLDPVRRRSDSLYERSVYWASVVTGYYNVSASVKLLDGKSLKLKRDFFNWESSTYVHRWDNLILKIELSNRFEDRKFHSNFCRVTVEGGSNSFWGFDNPGNDNYPYIEYSASRISGDEIYTGPFEQNEEPYIYGRPRHSGRLLAR